MLIDLVFHLQVVSNLKMKNKTKIRSCNTASPNVTKRGSEQNMTEAVKWCRKAARNGIAQAQYSLGLCYLNGEGAAADEEEGLNWIRRASGQGYPEAMEFLKDWTDCRSAGEDSGF